MNYLSRLTVILVFIFLIVACVTDQPARDFRVQLWKVDPEASTFYHLEEESGEILVMRMIDVDPREYILISIEDYNKERDYQDLLIKECENWR